MPQLRKRLALDLADALAGDTELAAHLLQRARMTVLQAETEADNLALALGQALQHLGQLLLQHRERGGIGGHHGGIVLDEVAELGVLLLADGGLKAHRLLGDLLDLADALGSESHLLADLLGGWLAAELLQKLALDAHELVDGLHHVHRNADGAGLVGDGAGDGLANPPGGVGGELEALGVVELLHRADETEVALLNEIQKQHAAAHIALGNGDHQAQIGLDELLLGVQAHLLDAAEAALLAAIQFHAVGLGALQLLGGGHTGLDLHGQIDFLGGGEQGHLADLLEVHAHRVAREHGHAGIGVAFGAVARPGLGARGDLRKGGGLHRGLQLLLGNAVQQILLGVNAGLDLVLGQAVRSRVVRRVRGRLRVVHVVVIQVVHLLDVLSHHDLFSFVLRILLCSISHAIVLSLASAPDFGHENAILAQRYSREEYYKEKTPSRENRPEVYPQQQLVIFA